MRKLILLSALFASSTASAAFFPGHSLPRPEREALQDMMGLCKAMKSRVDAVISKSGHGALENDSRATQYLLEFSTKLERLNDDLENADANWENDPAYGQAIKSACLETRRLFVINGLGERAAGEPSVGDIRPDNSVFGDSRIDVGDIRDTVFCTTYEKALQSKNWVAYSQWKSSYRVNHQNVEAHIDFQGDHGSYKTSGFIGQLKDLIYFDDHVSGRWQVGSDGGWIEFPLHGNAFNGHWGRGILGGPLGGEWWGKQ